LIGANDLKVLPSPPLVEAIEPGDLGYDLDPEAIKLGEVGCDLGVDATILWIDTNTLDDEAHDVVVATNPAPVACPPPSPALQLSAAPVRSPGRGTVWGT
jgi:hypothetical protein